MVPAEAAAGAQAVREPVRAYVGLGANVGQAAATLRWAAAALADLPGTELLQVSGLYRSDPIDCEPGAPAFLNAVAALSTRLSAPQLLAGLQQLELTAGRQRPYRNAPRTLDLDVLLYGDARIDSPALCVPHPRMGQRAFVLRPLAEIAPEWAQAAGQPAVAAQQVDRIGPLLP
ncbi:MAG: 2-amino-4-hydroxy-6-hydroxymethyldihydropteridine diphosphokinase [Betaproteobacteria bacterium]